MRISHFTVYGHANGELILNLGDDTNMSFKFTDDESAELRAAAMTIVERRQAALVSAAKQPFIALADFSETSF